MDTFPGLALDEGGCRMPRIAVINALLLAAALLGVIVLGCGTSNPTPPTMSDPNLATVEESDYAICTYVRSDGSETEWRIDDSDEVQGLKDALHQDMQGGWNDENVGSVGKYTIALYRNEDTQPLLVLFVITFNGTTWLQSRTQLCLNGQWTLDFLDRSFARFQESNDEGQ